MISSLLNAAVAAHRAGQLEEAERHYSGLLSKAPNVFDVWNLAGFCSLQRGRAKEAVERLLRARRLNSKNAQCLMRLGVARGRLGCYADAESSLRESLSLDPTMVEAWLQLAYLLRSAGRPQEALPPAQRALQLNPDMAEAHSFIGVVTSDLKGFTEALPHFERAASLAPDSAIHWCNVGIALATRGSESDALAAFDRSLRLQPKLAAAHLGRGLALQQLYRLKEALAAFEKVLELAPDHAEAHSARLLTLQYLDNVPREHRWAAHVAFGRSLPRPEPPVRPSPPASSSGRRRIGFLSADFRRHAVAQFIEPIIRHLDRDQWEVFLYHDHAIEDDVSHRFRTFVPHWRTIAGQPLDVVERRIRSDVLDVLVDLAGHTGRNRLPLFARRVAPLQVNYLGYPDTTGLPEMDLRLVDAITDPGPDDDRFHTERLVRFSPCAWVWRPPAEAPPVAPPPSMAQGRPITFGSFNNYAKVSDTTVRLWAGVLSELPNSRLLLKSHGLDRPEQQRAARQRFERAGVAGERIQFLGRQPDPASHLAHYAEIDIALDTYPYHGTTTTCEALWMGRPVITLAGDRHISRVGASLLTTAGHPEWIARDVGGYVRLATALATDRPRLATMSSSLRDEMGSSPLMDEPDQSRCFAAALRQCRQEPIAPAVKESPTIFLPSRGEPRGLAREETAGGPAAAAPNSYPIADP